MRLPAPCAAVQMDPCSPRAWLALAKCGSVGLPIAFYRWARVLTTGVIRPGASCGEWYDDDVSSLRFPTSQFHDTPLARRNTRSEPALRIHFAHRDSARQ